MKSLLTLAIAAASLLTGCASEAELQAADGANCSLSMPGEDNAAAVAQCVQRKAIERRRRTDLLIGLAGAVNDATPRYVPQPYVPVTLPQPSVYVPPPIDWSNTANYQRPVQAMPRFVPVEPGPATGAGGYSPLPLN
jgi:hypothetical protein